tara:strand:- start:332 stop:679 length:348 start_codon:yes stop_codon:yes gene_type:complete
MKVTKRFLRNLIKEVKGDDSCPAATQDQNLNLKNKKIAAKNPKIMYGHPSRVKKLRKLARENKLCGNCAAFDIGKKMIKCGGANKKGTAGYCKMHDFSCAAEKTCLTWAPGGPKR